MLVLGHLAGLLWLPETPAAPAPPPMTRFRVANARRSLLNQATSSCLGSRRYSLFNVVRSNPLHTCLSHIVPRFRERALKFNRPAGVPYHARLDAFPPRRDRRPDTASARRSPAQV